MGAASLVVLKARLDGPWAAELGGGSPAHSRGWDWVGFEVPSIPSHSVILWFYNSVILACSGEGRISSPNIIKAHLQVCVLMSDAVWDMLHILHLVNDKTILHCMPEF